MDKDTLFSSFGKWLEPICSKTFKEHIAETHQDKYVKKLTTPAYLKLFLHAQLQQRVLDREKSLMMFFRKNSKRNSGLNRFQRRN
ncbi:DUF4372 domain-containing protein [Paenibacillus hexagrammi]|uniref:DUF4372 domain-containing protein n=1 Tax=Paenibacillus hexagrammi TaxID=2908839 RepID=UPI003312FC78